MRLDHMFAFVCILVVGQSGSDLKHNNMAPIELMTAMTAICRYIVLYICCEGVGPYVGPHTRCMISCDLILCCSSV